MKKNEYFISFNTIYRETVSHGKKGADKQRHSEQTEKAEAVRNVIIKALKNEVVETITPDRGKEFAKYRAVTQELGGKQFYVPPPHQPWQRGTNENTNVLLREYFPKQKNITDYTDEYIAFVIDKINKRSRKCLGYKTPFEVYYSIRLHLI